MDKTVANDASKIDSHSFCLLLCYTFHFIWFCLAQLKAFSTQTILYINLRLQWIVFHWRCLHWVVFWQWDRIRDGKREWGRKKETKLSEDLIFYNLIQDSISFLHILSGPLFSTVYKHVQHKALEAHIPWLLKSLLSTTTSVCCWTNKLTNQFICICISFLFEKL